MRPDRWQRMADAVDRQSAETFFYQPMSAADLNGRASSSDSARAPQMLCAIWADPSVESNRRPRLDMSATRQGAGRQITAGRPSVKFQEAALPYSPAIGDTVRREATGDRYQVATIGGDGFGRIVLELTARGI